MVSLKVGSNDFVTLFFKFKVIWGACIYKTEFLCIVGLGFLIIEILKSKNYYILTCREESFGFFHSGSCDFLPCVRKYTKKSQQVDDAAEIVQCIDICSLMQYILEKYPCAGVPYIPSVSHMSNH